MRAGGLLPIIYLVVGALVAGSKNYFDNLDTLEQVLSALLAVALWPLLFVGVDFRVNL